MLAWNQCLSVDEKKVGTLMANRKEEDRELLVAFLEWYFYEQPLAPARKASITRFLNRKHPDPQQRQCGSHCRAHHNRRCQLRAGHSPVYHRSGPYAWIDNGIEQVTLRFGDR